ncbi:acyl-CoA thioesterase [Alteromonas ponticola]|uniref:Acyl-CoA thioesterase n=1 Tax=Alteromonas aquimaris TaxID=2998417 RepID=A0ABT3P834_9ALTE|nr:acyl-CoA thioesterase [Alteromonas aquimaris]MCW8108917.1 acyl-CoA thioesterase [Alteromonas aquimaris]
MKRIALDYDIPFFDVDAYRIVWHGNYPKYFEMARCALLKAIGCPYSVMEENGFFFPIVDIQVKYVKPLLFEQQVVIEAWLAEWENRLIIKYAIKDKKTGDVYTKAKTKQFAVSASDHVTHYVSPPFLIDAVDTWMQQDANS